MFQFTREFIINDLNGKLKAKTSDNVVSTLTGTGNKGRFAITEYKKDGNTTRTELMIDNFINIDKASVRSISKHEGKAAVNEVVELADLTTAITNAITNKTLVEGDYIRLSVVLTQEGRVISTFTNIYPLNSNRIFVEAKVGADAATTLTNLVENSTKADVFMGSRLAELAYENSNLTIKADDEFTRVDSIKVVKTNIDSVEKIGYADSISIFELHRRDIKFEGNSKKGDLGSGTTNILVRNNRLQTIENYNPYGTNRDERPVPAGIYDQYTIEIVTERNQVGHQVFGSVGDKSLTTVVIFALKDAVSTCLSECLDAIKNTAVGS